MIRRSAFVAAAALAASLLAHVLGLSLTLRSPSETGQSDTGTETVALGNAFEDIAEAAVEPVPEPPVVPQSEPEPAEIPTTMALVASPDPKPVASPDIGSAEDVPVGTARLAEPEQAAQAEPATAEAAAGQRNAVAAAPQAPVATESAAQAVESSARAEVADAAQPEPPVTPEVPIVAAIEPADIPLIPEETAPTDPEAAIAETESTDAGEDGGSELAVTSSLRPRAPTRNPTGSLGAGLDTGRDRSQVMESPLTAYRRDGNLDSWLGRQGSGGQGNSDVTNYAGRVLMQLNRVPEVRIPSGGSARVIFEINRDGTLAWVNVVNSTGTYEFDSAAREQVRRAAPFPPPPPGANRRLSFVYRSN